MLVEARNALKFSGSRQVCMESQLLGRSMHHQERSLIKLAFQDSSHITKSSSIMLYFRYFGEGLTRLGDFLYQLTWLTPKVFVYDLDLKQVGSTSGDLCLSCVRSRKENIH